MNPVQDDHHGIEIVFPGVEAADQNQRFLKKSNKLFVSERKQRCFRHRFWFLNSSCHNAHTLQDLLFWCCPADQNQRKTRLTNCCVYHLFWRLNSSCNNTNTTAAYFRETQKRPKKDCRLATGRMHGPMQSCVRNVLSPCACLHVVMLAGQVLVKMAEAANGMIGAPKPEIATMHLASNSSC